MPLYRKLPRRGFNQAQFRTEAAVVNLDDLKAIADDITEINAQVFADNGLLRKDETYVKVLGNGEITRALKITASKFSASAKEKIEKAGGEAIVA